MCETRVYSHGWTLSDERILLFITTAAAVHPTLKILLISNFHFHLNEKEDTKASKQEQ